MEFSSKIFSELTTTELYEILKSRTEVFLLEQNIICQDIDDVDYDALHCFIMDNGRVVACLRAFYKDEKKGTVQLGRVLTLSHGRGTGRELMQKSIEAVREKMNCKKIYVESQKQAIGFYEKFGFTVTSGEFLDAGVVHQSMEYVIPSA